MQTSTGPTSPERVIAAVKIVNPNGCAMSIPPVALGGSHPDARIQIMIADHHEMLRDCIRNLLSLEPDLLVVAETGTGEDVPALLVLHQPDIVLLNLEMRGADGITTLQRLQAININTRIIVLTESDDKEQSLLALRFGTSGILQKKTPTELLLKSIRKVHSGEIWLDRSIAAEVIRNFASLKDSVPVSLGTCDRDRSPLTNREHEIVMSVAQGFKNKDMAEKMLISEQTVKNHLHSVFKKLGVSDRLELALYAIQKGWHEAGPFPPGS